MAWSTTPHIHTFLGAAGAFLAAQPVAHSVLLTEAAYLEARPSAAPDQRYGWWRDAGGQVTGAFVRAPRHPPVVSDLPDEAIQALVDVLPDSLQVGVSEPLVDAVVAAWRRTGVDLTPSSRITLYRLADLRRPRPPSGQARVATPLDRDLLVSWYQRLMAAHPDDPSDLAYVVDDPLDYGGIVVWEVDGQPLAMAGRSRTVAGMVRLGPVYEPGGGQEYADAAFVAACEAAQLIADHVLVFVTADDATGTTFCRDLGFEPVLDRVLLAAS